MPKTRTRTKGITQGKRLNNNNNKKKKEKPLSKHITQGPPLTGNRADKIREPALVEGALTQVAAVLVLIQEHLKAAFHVGDGQVETYPLNATLGGVSLKRVGCGGNALWGPRGHDWGAKLKLAQDGG
ncbi:hypothetical protein E2C01_020481 [Portunus trituberculatus]|uniref:Uncharacterized protein n=1 Tax=Portunus trituberculatus TaxID=210409 RepID=A0A5B7DZW0_PORTR|nr:hypothetical protein [Portunus trituberculatus]